MSREFVTFCFWFFVVCVFLMGWYSKKALEDIKADEEEKLARRKIECSKALWDSNMKESEKLFEGGAKK